MKRLSTLCCAVLFAVPACSDRTKDVNLTTTRVGSVTAIPGTHPGVRLVSPLRNAEWRLPSGDYANTRFSPLDQLRPNNVSNLRVVPPVSTGSAHGHEGGPLVVGHPMYIVTPFPNTLIAVDLSKPSGAVNFIYEPHPDPRAVGIACC